MIDVWTRGAELEPRTPVIGKAVSPEGYMMTLNLASRIDSP